MTEISFFLFEYTDYATYSVFLMKKHKKAHTKYLFFYEINFPTLKLRELRILSFCHVKNT